MIFHSLDFAAFFLIVVTIYWRLPHRGAERCSCSRASYVFYGWVHPWFVLIMLVSTTRRLLGRPADGGRPGRASAATCGPAWA